MILVLKKCLQQLIVEYYRVKHGLRTLFKKNKDLNIGFLVEEFFHEELRGFGGFGMTIKYLTDHFNKNGHRLKGDVFLTSWVKVPEPIVKRYHNADVILLPHTPKNYVANFAGYAKITHSRNVDAFVSVDHYPSYEYQLLGFPSIPWIIWLKDPRDNEEWRKISTVSLEIKVMGKKTPADLLRMAQYQQDSIKRMIKHSRRYRRPIYFVTEALTLVGIARRLYDLPDIMPVFLPKPVTLPALSQANFSERPSFLYLGRIDPIKRPWVYFELAKRFPQANFYVAGSTHFPEIMEPITDKYRHLPNLKLLGRVVGKEKDEILNKVWATINPSVHEAVPVSFLESFAFGKPVISCQNPDYMTSRFGIYTGEILGDADDEKSFKIFSNAIQRMISGEADKKALGWAGRQYLESVHTFENYERTIRGILKEPGHL